VTVLKHLLPIILAQLIIPVLFAASPDPLRTRNAMIAADQTEAGAIGIKILKAGGNAFDAAVAVNLAIGVANPHSSGLGGGDFLMLYPQSEKRVVVIDSRETAPLKITPEHYRVDGIVQRKLSQEGGLAVAIPGNLKGLETMHRKYGKLSWKQVVQPSVELAKRGPVMTHYFHKVLTRYRQDFCDASEILCKIFYKNGRTVAVGEKLPRPRLAHTLEVIANYGVSSFYQGRIAQNIVDTVQGAGGVLTIQDLKEFQVREVAPVRTQFKGYQVYSMPSPSSGGTVLLQMLNVLEKFPLRSWGHNSSKSLHVIAEAMKHAYANRAQHMGDDRFVEVPTDKLLGANTIEKIRESIDFDKTQERDFYGSIFLEDDNGTTHFSVIDKEGNAAGITSTINTFFGSKLVVPEDGIILNNEMDDFSLAPGVPNAYGLIGSSANAIEPGKKPLSSMSPTIVMDGDHPLLVLGGSGGPRIISGTLQVILNALVYGMNAQEAVNAPRIHHQWVPEILYVEKEIPIDVRSNLILRGHKVRSLKWRNVIQAVYYPGEFLQGASDPRKGGQAVGY